MQRVLWHGLGVALVSFAAIVATAEQPEDADWAKIYMDEKQGYADGAKYMAQGAITQANDADLQADTDEILCTDQFYETQGDIQHYDKGEPREAYGLQQFGYGDGDYADAVDFEAEGNAAYQAGDYDTAEIKYATAEIFYGYAYDHYSAAEEHLTGDPPGSLKSAKYYYEAASAEYVKGI